MNYKRDGLTADTWTVIWRRDFVQYC